MFSTLLLGRTSCVLPGRQALAMKQNLDEARQQGGIQATGIDLGCQPLPPPQ